MFSHTELAGTSVQSTTVIISCVETPSNSVATNAQSTGLHTDSFLQWKTISRLHCPEYELLKQIRITVEKVGPGEYVAAFHEAGVFASGETASEAEFMLMDAILGTFEHLSATPLEKLGPYPRRQLSSLRSVMRRLW